MCMCVRGVQKGVKTIENDASQIIKHSMRYKSQTLYNIKTHGGWGWMVVARRVAQSNGMAQTI